MDSLALRMRAALESVASPLARAAASFVEQKAWTFFGFARLEDHARERFGRSSRWLHDMAALGRAIAAHPRLDLALTGDDGGEPIGTVAAQQIARVASAESLAAWIEVVRSNNVRAVKRMVRAARERGSKWPVDERGERLPSPTGDSAVDSAVAGPFEVDVERSDERCLIRFPVPAPVAAAFDETLELHRAVNGRESTVCSFVDALIAESFAGPRPPDVDRLPLRRVRDTAAIEACLGRATNNWAGLPPAARSASATLLAAETLALLRHHAARAGVGGPEELDQQVRTLLALEDRIHRRLGTLLEEMRRFGAWSRLMFTGVGHYAEQRLGLGRTAAEDRTMLARALMRLPVLRGAYESGAIGFEAALIVVRTLGKDRVESRLEREWVDRARACSIKRLRDERRLLARRRLADPGCNPARPVGDAAWHEALRRDPGTAQVAVVALGERAGGAGLPDVFLRLRLPSEVAEGFLAVIEGRRLELTRMVEQVAWDEPWPDADAPPSVTIARTFSVRCRRVPAWVALLAVLEDFVATWDDPRGMPPRKSDSIYRRDGWRCTAPGCTSRRNLEDHHIEFRSRGGSDDPSNRTCSCSFHHQRGVHGSLASCRGTAPLGIVWRIGRPEVAVAYRNELRLNRGRDLL
jgi:hypothetical protein